MEKFDNEVYEERLAERYVQLAKYDAFDKLVDLALDGVIKMSDAKTAWETEVVTHTRR